MTVDDEPAGGGEDEPTAPSRWPAVRRLLLGGGVVVALAWLYRPLFQGRVLAGRDLFRIAIPDAHFLLESLKAHRLPLWTPYLRLGQPFLATQQSQVLYPLRLLPVLALGPLWGLTLQHLLQVVIALGGMWRLARRLRLSFAASVLVAASFGLSAWYTVLANEPNMASALCWSGWMVAAALDLGRSRRAVDMSWLALWGTLSFLGGSPETTLWQGGVCLAALARGQRPLQQVLLGVLALGWSFALGAAVGIPGLEFAAHSERMGLSDRGALTWSTSWTQLFNTLLPGAQEPTSGYFGADQMLLLNGVFGSAAGLLALLGAWKARRGRVWGLCALVFAALCLGRNFPPARWVLTLPLLSSFRYPAKYLTGFFFCASVLAGLGLDWTAAWARWRGRRGRDALIFVLVTAGFTALVLVLTRVLHARSGLHAGLAWLVLVAFFAATAVLALPEGEWRGQRARTALLVVALLELALLNVLGGRAATADPRRMGAPSALLPYLPLRPTDDRVRIETRDFDATTSAEPAPTPSPTPAPAEPRVHDLDHLLDDDRDALEPNLPIMDHLRLTDGESTPETERLQRFFKAGAAAYALAGTRYFVFEGKPFEVEGMRELPLPRTPPRIFTWDAAQPRAAVLHRARLAPDAEVLQALAGPLSAFKREVWLAEGNVERSEDCSGDAVRWVKDTPEELELSVDACGPGYLRLADAYFPGWKAWVDGAPAPIWRSDFMLRAVPLGAGTHTVRFAYQPRSFVLGVTVSAAAWLLFLVVRVRAARARPAALV